MVVAIFFVFDHHARRLLGVRSAAHFKVEIRVRQIQVAKK
jgi:hypothetical protein